MRRVIEREQFVARARFVDVQLKGPYRLWRHTHEFIDAAAGTIVRDRLAGASLSVTGAAYRSAALVGTRRGGIDLRRPASACSPSRGTRRGSRASRADAGSSAG
jgi:hypothetical protein